MNDANQQENYRQHRLRIQNATSLVNSQAPKPKPTNEEVKNCTFLDIFKSLTNIKREKTKTKLLVRIEDIKKQLQGDDKVNATKKNFKDCPVPQHVKQRYEHLSFTQDYNLMQRLLRPCIFLELMDSRGQPLGRLVVQLFTEACPEVVQEFIGTCLAKRHDRFHITRLLSPLWLEAELSFDNKNALTSNNIEHDPMAVNHGSSSGILSFPSRYLRGSKLNFITFTVSFTAINVLNGKRIAFGIVRCGQKVLERLQCFEVTRSGKPCKNVIVSACGVY